MKRLIVNGQWWIEKRWGQELGVGKKFTLMGIRILNH